MKEMEKITSPLTMRDVISENFSYFINNICIFGHYPTKEEVDFLESEGVILFVDLTTGFEKGTIPYETKGYKWHFPIKDGKVPEESKNIKDYINFLIKLSQVVWELKNVNKKMYLHCRGGHGRSGTTAACMLCHIFKLTPSEAIMTINNIHSKRPNVINHRRRFHPLHYIQRSFIYQIFKPFKVFEISTNLLSNTFTSIFIFNEQLFLNVDSAYKKLLGIYITGQPINKHYKIKKLLMTQLVELKFKNNPGLLSKLLETNLRPIFYVIDDKENILIKNVLEEIRFKYLTLK